MHAKLSEVCTVVALALTAVFPRVTAAQTPAPPVAKLTVTVVDPSGAVLPNATVTVVGAEAATKAVTPDPFKTNDKGQATIEKLVPGRYTLRAEFPGFAPTDLRDQRLRSGDNKHVIVLPLKRMEEGVVVGRDPRDVATDRTLTFGSVLTREQIQALSDDPDEMRRQLQEMAGPDAVIRVDSFEGQQLPPKAQIKSIRISRDQFAAENHGAFSHIDIVTQPGIGPMRTSVRGSFYDSSLDGKNPVVNARGPGQNRSGGATFGGSLIKEKADFSLSFNGTNSWSTPQLNATSVTGQPQQGNLAIRTPIVDTSVSGLLNYALTRDQTIRFGFSGGHTDRENLGVGQFDNVERAYSIEGTNWGVRLQEVGPLGRRFVTNTRFMLNATTSDTQPAFDGPTTVVQGEFTSGGAQRRGGSENRSFAFNQDLDYVRGLHSWRGGIMLDGGYSETSTSTNYLGTYTFASLDAFRQGKPRSYSRRIGDPSFSYWNVQTALYVQDDWRLRKRLSISVGMRYQMQMRVQDRANFAPRAGFTWSPLASGRMSVRGSWGVFYDWFPMNTYAQTLQTDGTRQREVNIMNPTYPDPGPLTGTSAPTNRYLLEDSRKMPQTNRTSLGVSGSIKRLSLSATYSYQRGSNILSGQQLNAPVNGVRPDPNFANVIRAVGQGESYSHQVEGGVSLSLAPRAAPGGMPMGGPAAGQPFFSLRRGLFVSSFFNLNRSRSNTEGPFSLPFTGDLSKEWGPTFGGPWSLHANINSQMIRNLGFNLSVSANAGPYYTITTGLDDNGDLIFNDRPAGVGRGTERGAAQISTHMGINYSIGFGRRSSAGGMPPGMPMIIEAAGARVSVMQGPGGVGGTPRYRLMFGVNIQNPTNRPNYGGYSGQMNSTKFRQPLSAFGVRQIRFNMGLSF